MYIVLNQLGQGETTEVTFHSSLLKGSSAFSAAKKQRKAQEESDACVTLYNAEGLKLIFEDGLPVLTDETTGMQTEKEPLRYWESNNTLGDDY